MQLTLRSRQHGWMMLEMLLATLLIISLSTYLLSQQSEVGRDIEAKNASTGMLDVAAAGKAYIDANYSAVLAAAADGSGAATICVVNASATTGTGGSTANNTTKHTCAFDVNWLKFKGFLNAGFRISDAAGSRWVVIARRVYDTAGDPTQNMEMLVVPASSVNGVAVSPAPVTNIKMVSFEKGAVLAGTVAGVVPNGVGHPCGWHATDNNLRFVCGVQGAWKATLGNFVN